MFSDLEAQRRAASSVLLLAVWAFVPLIAGTMLLVGASWELLTAASAGVAMLTTATARFSRQDALRVTIAVALVAQVSFLLAGLAGHPLQIDMHMAYFAVLAVLAVYCDWRVIVAATVGIALHHLTLNFAYPAAIYPGGADLGRVTLHAAVVVMEAAVLTLMTANIASMFDRVTTAVGAAETAQEVAERANQEADAVRHKEMETREQQDAERRRAAAEQALVVSAIGTGLSQLADGDLTGGVQAFPGEYKKLETDFNSALARLRETIAVIAGNGQGIRSGSGEISQAAENLSKRTEQQAASLEETAAALDEITATVRKTADGAKHANEVVSAARTDAERSGKVVQNAMSAMTAIEKSAGEISQIIGVIDEIAFQTNLLALNAGVEAARAGDSGRGFAVVASEVRALAQRSAAAAKEIKALIQTSSSQVEAGVDLVGQAGQALSRIAAQVSEIDEIVSEIAASASEQATGLQQVNTAVNQMDQMTQQNAAMVEESTAASHSLAQEADTLASLISRFRTGGEAAVGRPVALRRSSPAKSVSHTRSAT